MWTAAAELAIKAVSFFMVFLQKRKIRQEVVNEAAAKENAALAKDIAISDRVDNCVDLDTMRTKLNERP